MLVSFFSKTTLLLAFACAATSVFAPKRGERRHRSTETPSPLSTGSSFSAASSIANQIAELLKKLRSKDLTLSARTRLEASLERLRAIPADMPPFFLE